MASPSESSNVIIVFKGSSNPAVSDQSVQCQINWTVKQLKQHLCQVYPGNPMLEEQRLIYSGQLLHDHLMLKDILRQYNEQTIHTIHIVCNREQSSSTQHNSPSRQTSTPRESTSLSTPSTSTLRHRNVQGPPPSPLMYSQAQAMMYQQAMQAVSWSTMNAEQLAWMQQAYTQFMGYYIQNYQMAASNPNLMATPMTAPLPQSPTPLPQNAAPPNPPPPPPVNNDNNVQMNAQGGPVDEDEEDLGNRDWLDWFYVVTRAAVLFSIVYFYSSLSRFVLVTALAALFYIYQIGWFRAHAPRRVRQQAAPPPAAPVVQQPAPAAENEEEQRHMENMMDANMEGQERPLQEGESSQQEPPPQHTLVNLAWTFLISFFSSLIPEQPPPVNAN